MAALADNFHGWRVVPGTGAISMEITSGAVTEEWYRGAIGTTAVGAAVTLKVTNGVTTDIPFGIVEKRTSTSGTAALIPCTVNGVIWFTGVAGIATASGLQVLYPLLNSDNPADLTATAAGNCSAFGRIIAIETTAVSGYIDQAQKYAVAETA